MFWGKWLPFSKNFPEDPKNTKIRILYPKNTTSIHITLLWKCPPPPPPGAQTLQQKIVMTLVFLGPIYTITNTQRIRIYPGKLKFVPVKISPDSGRLHGKHARENHTLGYLHFLLLGIYSDSPVYTSANPERIQIYPVMW